MIHVMLAIMNGTYVHRKIGLQGSSLQFQTIEFGIHARLTDFREVSMVIQTYVLNMSVILLVENHRGCLVVRR